MDTRSTEFSSDTDLEATQGRLAGATTAIKNKLGDLGRRAKHIELRETIVAHPMPSLGIAIAAGALVGLVRAKPESSRVGSAIFAMLGAVTVRLVREAAFRQVGAFAKQFLQNDYGDSSVHYKATSSAKSV